MLEQITKGVTQERRDNPHILAHVSNLAHNNTEKTPANLAVQDSVREESKKSTAKPVLGTQSLHFDPSTGKNCVRIFSETRQTPAKRLSSNWICPIWASTASSSPP